jgi:hypothetical protein
MTSEMAGLLLPHCRHLPEGILNNTLPIPVISQSQTKDLPESFVAALE